MYEDIEALREALRMPGTASAAPPPLPASLPPSKPPMGNRSLPEAPSIYNKYTPGFPGPKATKSDVIDIYDSGSMATPGSNTATPKPPPPNTATPKPPPPSTAPPTSTTANANKTSLPKWPPSSNTNKNSLPKWPPSCNAPAPQPPKPKAVDNPDDVSERRSNKPQPAADGKFYCGVCREEIVGHQGIVTYQDNIWHTYCFKCFECKRPLRGVQFVRREKEVHCYDCFLRKYAPRCSVCNKNITENDGMKLQDKAYHRKCFTCSACNGELVGKKFTLQDKKPFCYDCYLKFYSKKCSKCNEYITGAYVDLGEIAYHEDCFKCSICKGMFTDGMMYKNSEGEFACSTCASVL